MPIAMYAGSFDPVTNGHIDIIQRASGLFGGLVVAVAMNLEKEPLFSLEERVGMVQTACADMPDVRVECMPRGLLVDFAAHIGASVIVRGLRAVSDFDYELQLSLVNRNMRPDLETVFLMTGQEHYFLSSSIVKQIARLGGSVSRFVPSHVEELLRARFDT
jgi:pantetheine-phosphate adenylyltransferase